MVTLISQPVAMTDEGQLSNYCSQTLDKWLTQVGKEKGEDALKIVKDVFHNNLRANMTFYETLASEAEKIGENEIAAQNRQTAKLYKGLLESP